MAIAPRWPLIALGALGGMLAGCAAPGPQDRIMVPAHIPDPSSDWRRFAVAPFGSLLQDVHVPVHEVLMFGEQAKLECYALDAPAGSIFGRAVESYLLCYSRGRLDRVELSFSVPEAGAEAEFSRYCDDWLTGTVAVSPRTSVSCGGAAAQGLSFSASLGGSADAAPDGTAAVALSIVVSETAQR
jgi:hypothetical protein